MELSLNTVNMFLLFSILKHEDGSVFCVSASGNMGSDATVPLSLTGQSIQTKHRFQSQSLAAYFIITVYFWKAHAPNPLS